ncbi:MAG TPA: DUF2079 domain-containing protein [Xanthomonadales bacterium]|nr:DUF2079 domain-containing protein [Xanthomonadales bacterium]
MQNRLISILKYVLGWPFSILAFFFILKLIIPKIPEFTTSLRNVNITLLSLGVLSFLLFYFIRSYIWHRLVKLYSKDISYKHSAYFWAISEFKRYIPGNVWGFVGRTLKFSDMGIEKKTVGRLILIEAGIFVIGATIISLLSLPFLGFYFWHLLGTYQTALVLLILSLAIFYVVSKKPIGVFMNFAPDIKMSLVFLSVVALLFFGLGYYFVIASFVLLPIHLIPQLVGFFVLSTLLGVLSFLTPAGFGVREGLMIAGLSKIISLSQSAFGALFARVMLIVSELVFILFSYFWHKTRNTKLLSIEKWIAHNKYETVLIGITLIYIAYFTWISFLRYDHFYTGRFDLGNMAQTVWNTTQGRIFQFSNPDGTEIISRLAFHADFLLILLAPFYALFPTPKTLLFIQTVVVALGSFFIYEIAKDKLKNKNLSLVFAFAYLINPSVQRANLYDFHPVTLATTFLLGTYYFYSKKRYALFLIFALLAAISKEQIWLIIALFGGLLFFKQKKRVFGGLIFVASFAIFYYLISVAIPNALGSSHFAMSYYSNFGDSPVSIAKSIFLSPQKVIETIYQEDKINYLIQIFSPLGYLSFIYPFFLILAGPDLAINLLSNNAQLHQIYYQYTAAITPFIFISAIFGTGILAGYINKRYLLILPVFILTTSLIGAYRYGVLPGSKGANLDMITKQVPDHKFIDETLSDIPSNLSVASSNNVGSHLTHRRSLYTLPLGIDKADVVVFFPTATEQPQSIAEQKKQLNKMRTDSRYEIDVEKGSFAIFRKKKI